MKEIPKFKYLESVHMTDGSLDVKLNLRKGKAVGRFKQFANMCGRKHVSLATDC